MIELQLAEMQELDRCYEILDQGRKFQQEQGFVQRTEDYPSRQTVLSDIQNRIGYVVRLDGAIAGYLCITSEPEPAYRDIVGAWRQDAPYVVVHRWALGRDFCGKGLADATLKLVDALCLQQGIAYIRADTDFPNRRMQHILEKNGYVRCGEVIFQGSPKIAYDKILGERR